MAIASYQSMSVMAHMIDHYDAVSAELYSFDKEQKKRIAEDLNDIREKLATKARLAYIGARHEEFLKLHKEIKRVEFLYKKIDLKNVDQGLSASNYLALSLILPHLAMAMSSIARGKKKKLIDILSTTNEKRLYWVWASATVPLLLSQVQPKPNQAIGLDQALKNIGLLTGSMSWMLYFLRAGLEWHSLLSHTFTVFMSDEERAYYAMHPEITWQMRFAEQWDKRKYALMNDTFWGLCNFACFWLLVGTQQLVMLNYAVTLLLLFMDLSLMLYRWHEIAQDYEKKRQEFQEDIQALKAQYQTALESNESSRASVLNMQIRWMENQQMLEENEWAYQTQKAGLDAVYAVLLFAAFAMAMIAAFPPVALAPATLLCLGVVGTLLCFSLNILNNGIGISFAWAKHQKNSEVYAKALTSEGISSNEKFKLEQDQLKEEKMIQYQKGFLVSSTFEALVIPPLVMVSFALLPWGVGIPMLIVGLLCIGLMHYTVGQLKPEENLVPVLQNDENFGPPLEI